MRPPSGVTKIKVSPSLTEYVSTTKAEVLDVLIRFVDDRPLPRFPEYLKSLPPSHPKNTAVLERRRELARRAVDENRVANAQILSALKAEGAAITEYFWIVNGVAASIPLEALPRIAALPKVKYVELARTAVPPPTIFQGRTAIRSDLFYDAATYALEYWRIALLDTGMPITAGGSITHTLFNNDPIRIRGFDCVNAAADSLCDAPAPGLVLNPTDDCWNHGISSASILTANGALGNDYRGVTRFSVDGYKVYDQNGSGSDCDNGLGLNLTAASRAFEVAVINGADVIVAEMQDHKGSIVTEAADRAFDAGCLIIAAAGNFPGEIRAPGEGHKSIAVGAVDAWSLEQYAGQGTGPEADGRTKPEIQGPTNTTTASNEGYSATRSFCCTSGSTPYLGGAAALFAWWLDADDSWNRPPGWIYSYIILNGNNYSDPTSNNTRGSGLLRMPLWGRPGGSGYVWLGQGEVTDIWREITNSHAYDLTAALWWPETASQSHNDVDLYLVTPDSVQIAYSLSTSSIFEKARAAGNLQLGWWRVRIVRKLGGTSGGQKVFYSYYYKEQQQPD